MLTPQRISCLKEVMSRMGDVLRKIAPNILFSKQAKEGAACSRTTMQVLDPGSNKVMVVTTILVVMTEDKAREVNPTLTFEQRTPETPFRPSDN